MQTITFKSVPSTNKYLKKHLDDYQGDVCIHAYHQSDGKGRRGRVWSSGDGENLLVTYHISCIDTNAKALFTSALSVLKTLETYGISADIKLPNDILHNNRKLSGILIENLTGKNKIIIGIGLNVNETFTDHFPNAISMSMINGTTYDIDAVRDVLSDNMTHYASKPEETLLEAFKVKLFKNDIFAFHGEKSVEVQDIDSKFNCKVDGSWLSCDVLEFSLPKRK